MRFEVDGFCYFSDIIELIFIVMRGVCLWGRKLEDEEGFGKKERGLGIW